MGLDIRAYSDLQLSENQDEEFYEEHWETYCRPYINPDFPERCTEFEDKYYTFEKTMGFRAGSYGGYGLWREELAKLAGYVPVATTLFKGGDLILRHDAGAWEQNGGPFWELINFSDCEGTLGTSVCEKLYDDFVAYDTKAQSHCPDDDNWFYNRYMKWLEAFELASQGGCVSFL